MRVSSLVDLTSNKFSQLPFLKDASGDLYLMSLHSLMKKTLEKIDSSPKSPSDFKENFEESNNGKNEKKIGIQNSEEYLGSKVFYNFLS